MAERGILFSGAMVRALLEGQKTQTRRVVRPQPPPPLTHGGGITWVFDAKRGLHVPHGTIANLSVREKMGLRCRYGVPGDRLWVRETWAPARDGDSGKTVAIYRERWEAHGKPQGPVEDEYWRGWKPNIFMPRWASRLTLEVTDVRVERLQAITQADALAEGMVDTRGAFDGLTDASRAGPRGGFEAVWNAINGPDAWDANPWVWRIAFARVTP